MGKMEERFGITDNKNMSNVVYDSVLDALEEVNKKKETIPREEHIWIESEEESICSVCI